MDIREKIKNFQLSIPSLSVLTGIPSHSLYNWRGYKSEVNDEDLVTLTTFFKDTSGKSKNELKKMVGEVKKSKTRTPSTYDKGVTSATANKRHSTASIGGTVHEDSTVYPAQTTVNEKPAADTPASSKNDRKSKADSVNLSSTKNDQDMITASFLSVIQKAQEIIQEEQSQKSRLIALLENAYGIAKEEQPIPNTRVV